MGTKIAKLNGLEWTQDDLVKKFGATYLCGTLEEDKKPIQGIVPQKFTNCLVYISDPSFPLVEGGIGIAGSYKTTPGAAAVKFMGRLQNFLVEEDRPSSCLSNIGETGALMFSYNPDRQWKRGFCDHNSFLFDTPSFAKSRLDWTRAFAILNPQYSNLTTALKEFLDPKVTGRALDNRYWLVRKAGDDAISLFRRKAYMGSFLGKRFFVNESARIMQEELSTEIPLLKEKYAFV